MKSNQFLQRVTQMIGRVRRRKVWSVFAFLPLLFCLVMVPGGCTVPDGITEHDPASIDCRVRRELHIKYDRYPALRKVRIEMGEEGVILSGTVPSTRDRERAEDIADGMPGTGRVKNLIKVKEK